MTEDERGPFPLRIIDINDTQQLLKAAINTSGEATSSEEKMLIEMDGVSVTAKPRKDGRYQGYVLQNGKKKYLYGKSPEEVKNKIKAFLRTQESAPQRKKREPKKSPLFGAYAANWAEKYKKPNLKPSSYETFLFALKAAVKALGDKPLDSITSDDLQDLFLGMGATRKRDICAVYVGQLFRHAIKTGEIKRDPMSVVQLSKREAEKRPALTPEQQARFLEATAASPNALLFRFLLATGLRIGEALAITPADVDRQAATVSVNKDIVFIGGKAIVQTPKSKAAFRTVPVPRDLCSELSTEGERIFPQTYNAVQQCCKGYQQKLGFRVSPHILRHTYATRLEEAGIPPKIKQYLMGHASLDMTQSVYTDTQAHYIEAFADRVRGAFDT